MIDDDADALAYPRPLLRRKSWSSLNGPWSFAIDAEAIWSDPGRVVWGKTIEAPFATALARRIVSELGADPGLVEEVEPHELGRVARRPRYSALGSERGSLMPTLDRSLASLFRDRVGAPAPVTS